MRTGADRVDVPYLWPKTLRVPPSPPKLIYLDLNHWIELAKAAAGHDDGKIHSETLDACLDAVESKRAVFPISDSTYFEVSKIRQHRQRHNLREVIEKVSRYMVVTSRSVVSVHETEAMLDQLIGPNPNPINSMDYLDWGVARAFGMVGGFRVRTASGVDITAVVRSQHRDGPEMFDEALASAELDLNRQILDGPTLEEEPELRNLGWDPIAAFAVSERRAEQEIEQVGRLNVDPKWRRGRIRDVVAARELYIEINDHLSRGILERGATLEGFFQTPEEARRALDAMPSFDVAVTLKTEYHKDPMHRWTSNDIHDIDALGSTLPYCHVVVADKAVASQVDRTGLSERLETIALWRLQDLSPYLAEAAS